jgi:hypothetical protein
MRTKSFHEKQIYDMFFVEKDKIGVKISLFTIYFLSLHKAQKIPVFLKTLRTHIDCGHVHAN